MIDPKNRNKKYRINEVTQMVGLSQKRIREYEKEGFVKPAREARTNNRIYMQADIDRIRRVKQLIHEYGFTLSCLTYFIVSAPCWIVYGCTEKSGCPAYQTPHLPCYDVMQKADASHIHQCLSCLIYINRSRPSFSLFDKT